MTKIRINITKDILRRSANCISVNAPENCAVALAIKDIFPRASVGQCNIYASGGKIPLPPEATVFIADFDSALAGERLQMEEISFEIDVPDNIMATLNIDAVKTILTNHPTMELVEA